MRPWWSTTLGGGESDLPSLILSDLIEATIFSRFDHLQERTNAMRGTQNLPTPTGQRELLELYKRTSTLYPRA
jgi:hypothetical protein